MRAPRNAHGFTLVEVLIVVVVLGILAAVAVPKFAGAQDEGAAAAFMEEVRIIEQAAERCYAMTGAFPNDTGHRGTPTELLPYLKSNPFPDDTPIGGEWDWNNFPDRVSVRAINGTWPQSKIVSLIDAKYDDGDAATGRITAVAGVCEYWILRK